MLYMFVSKLFSRLLVLFLTTSFESTQSKPFASKIVILFCQIFLDGVADYLPNPAELDSFALDAEEWVIVKYLKFSSYNFEAA